MGILPSHLLEGKEMISTPFGRNPIGTGPFRFRRWLQGSRLELEANPNYFEGRPFLQRYIVRIIPDQATLFLELQAQGVDFAGLTPLQHSRMTNSRRFTDAFNKFRYPSFGYTYLGYNLRDPKFQDCRVRQAINLAINKQEIIDGVLLGLGKKTSGPFPHESWAYNPKVQAAAFNPSQAKALLKEAGWTDSDADGILDKDGIPFAFTILTNQGNLPRELSAQIIQRRLADIGIRVKVRILEWSSLLHEFIDKHRFEAILLGWALSRDPDLFDIWHSSKIRPGEFNFIGYANLEVDRLLEKGRSTFELEERKEAYYQIHQILNEDQPVCFLYVPDALPVVHRRFEGVEVGPIGIGYNLIHWYTPPSRQRYRLAP